jgi:hypothetical protein
LVPVERIRRHFTLPPGRADGASSSQLSRDSKNPTTRPMASAVIGDRYPKSRSRAACPERQLTMIGGRQGRWWSSVIVSQEHHGYDAR